MERPVRPGAGEVESGASLSILDCVALPVLVVDHQGLVVHANRAALLALGFDELSEIRGQHPAADGPMLGPSRTGRPVHRNEDRFIRRDGTSIPVSFTSVPLDLPSGPGVVMTFVVTSAQRATER